jgi:hypothetical protein
MRPGELVGLVAKEKIDAGLVIEIMDMDLVIRKLKDV